MGEEPDTIRAGREETGERMGDTVELDIRPTERLAALAYKATSRPQRRNR